MLTFALLALMSMAVHADNHFGNLRYAGAEVQLRKMKFKGGYGDNSLPSVAREENLFLGFVVNDNLSLEVGFSKDDMKTRRSAMKTGDVVNGAAIVATLSPIIFESRVRIKGPYLSLMHHCSIDGTPFTFLNGLGVSFLKATSERRTVSSAGYPGTTERKLLEHKIVLRLTSGAQYDINENVFARGTLGWVNTRRVVIAVHNGLPNRIKPKVKPKDSLILGIGLGYSF